MRLTIPAAQTAQSQGEIFWIAASNSIIGANTNLTWDQPNPIRNNLSGFSWAPGTIGEFRLQPGVYKVEVHAVIQSSSRLTVWGLYCYINGSRRVSHNGGAFTRQVGSTGEHENYVASVKWSNFLWVNVATNHYRFALEREHGENVAQALTILDSNATQLQIQKINEDFS